MVACRIVLAQLRPANAVLLRAMVHAQSLDPVLVQMLAFEFNLHPVLVAAARDSEDVEMVSLAFVSIA
jgi:hypothetical protein